MMESSFGNLMSILFNIIALIQQISSYEIEFMIFCWVILSIVKNVCRNRINIYVYVRFFYCFPQISSLLSQRPREKPFVCIATDFDRSGFEKKWRAEINRETIKTYRERS